MPVAHGTNKNIVVQASTLTGAHASIPPLTGGWNDFQVSCDNPMGHREGEYEGPDDALPDPPGWQVIKRCARPNCPRKFIPAVAVQKYCTPLCCDRANNQKERDRAAQKRLAIP